MGDKGKNIARIVSFTKYLVFLKTTKKWLSTNDVGQVGYLLTFIKLFNEGNV